VAGDEPAIAVRRGDLTQMSCAFTVDRDEWSTDGTKRWIYSFATLDDISAVTYPASSTISVKVAS
jgi:phage head maturation protease